MPTRPARNILESLQDTILLEGALAADALGHGLTSFRRYSFADKGSFYGAMFSTSIGLERALKLVAVFDHALTNNTLMSDDKLKKIGHNIQDLLSHSRTVRTRHSLSVDDTVLSDKVIINAITEIHNFAQHSRYYNLDTLSRGAAKRGSIEPLASWDANVCVPILQRHHRVTSKQRESSAMAEKMSAGFVVFHTRENGTEVRNMQDLVCESNKVESKQKWSTFYVLRLIEYCVEVLSALDHRLRTPTYIGEYFAIFHTLDRQASLRRKRWLPLR